ncbi:MAG: ABC transporter ATP-binding protein [Candidatus Brocadiae bacterium]|nr:ABC transporter ATP-binding protein [Candidatus Brocadiia bacterium]
MNRKLETVVKIEGISKKYTIKHQQGKARYQTLRESIENVCKNILGKNRGQTQEEFWALKDINCEIARGERVAFIGRNGAGKSTLLKILCRVTHPTTGRITMRGKVASILEVGTGFHHELTGRENIYMNGAILGMSKQEIKKKFDDIVQFSEIEKFLDTPVKRYSSGMYVRLAFSVAAHLFSDILIVDEVLAVGDYQFREKCLQKMNSVAIEEQRTILFVSHSIEYIKRLCTRTIWLQEGKIQRDSVDIEETMKLYTSQEASSYALPSVWLSNQRREKQNKNPYYSIKKFYLGDNEGKNLYTIENDDIYFVYVELDVMEEHAFLSAGYRVVHENGMLVYFSGSSDKGIGKIPPLKQGFNQIRSQIPAHFLREGMYKVEFIGYLCNQEFPFLHPSFTKVPFFTFEVANDLKEKEFWKEKDTLVSPVVEWEIKVHEV